MSKFVEGVGAHSTPRQIVVHKVTADGFKTGRKKNPKKQDSQKKDPKSKKERVEAKDVPNRKKERAEAKDVPSRKKEHAEAKAVARRGGVKQRGTTKKSVGKKGAARAAQAGKVGEVVKEIKLFKHDFQYHFRIRDRALQDPKAHNFPYSFDDKIFRVKPINQEDGSLLFRRQGTLNGTNGFFEIGLNPDTGIIFHRTFVREKATK